MRKAQRFDIVALTRVTLVFDQEVPQRRTGAYSHMTTSSQVPIHLLELESSPACAL